MSSHSTRTPQDTQSSVAYIYALSDPRTNEIRYIGKARNPNYRLREHLRTSRVQRTHKANWIRELQRLELEPDLSFVCVVNDDNWGIVEQGWIDKGKQLGWPLTNQAAGGRGGGAHLGHKMSAATIEKIRRANLGRKQSQEAIAKTAAANRGRPRPLEVRLRIGASHKGKKPSPEAVAKTVAANTGRKHSKELYEKRAASMRGKKRKPEDMRKTAVVQRGLSVEDARKVLELSAAGMFQRDIAKTFGVSQTTVWKIVNHKHTYAYEEAYA